MATKESDIQHIGKQKFWTGEWVALCGHTLPPERGERVGMFLSLVLTACKDCQIAWEHGERP